jgi:glycosyltransferase involved in cell wall biosynthesis
VLEAMSVGCPVITSNVSSIPEIANSQNSFIVNSESVSEISDAMYEILMDKGRAQEKVEQAKIDSQKFSWNKFTQKVLEEVSTIKK